MTSRSLARFSHKEAMAMFEKCVIWLRHQPEATVGNTSTQLQAFLEDHSPDVVTLKETFTKKGYKYNMHHYTAVTRNREHGKRGGVTILLRHDLAYTEIDAIQLTSATANEQLTVAIRIDSNRELYVSTVYCPHANPSVELIDGLCENRDQIILTGDFNSKHTELGNEQTKPSGTRLVTATQNNNLTLITDGTPTFLTRLGKEDVKLIRQKRHQRRLWQKTRVPQYKTNSNRLQKRISKDITTRKRDSWKKYCDDMGLSEG